jgi:hypothetical protein
MIWPRRKPMRARPSSATWRACSNTGWKCRVMRRYCPQMEANKTGHMERKDRQFLRPLSLLPNPTPSAHPANRFYRPRASRKNWRASRKVCAAAAPKSWSVEKGRPHSRPGPADQRIGSCDSVIGQGGWPTQSISPPTPPGGAPAQVPVSFILLFGPTRALRDGCPRPPAGPVSVSHPAPATDSRRPVSARQHGPRITEDTHESD